MLTPILLVVEDLSTGQHVLKLLSEKFDYAADLVGSGEEALEAMKDNWYGCVLIDVALPGIDGYEATRRIRKLELNSGRHTAIVAITEHTKKHDLEAGQAAGMDDYLEKSFDSEELRKILLRYVYDAEHPNLKVVCQSVDANQVRMRSETSCQME